VDTAGNVFVAHGPTLRKVTPDGVVTTLAGCDTCADPIGSADGTGSAARFYFLNGVAVDSATNVYVADTFNDTIRKITPAGVVTTLAGSARQSSGVDGIGSAARFSEPMGLAVDSTGQIYVVDFANNRITKGTPLFQFQDSTRNLTISTDLFEIRLVGPFDSRVIVESSVNLQVWTPIQTNALAPDGLEMSVPVIANQNQFFRARLRR
jgi:hypothetical protein